MMTTTSTDPTRGLGADHPHRPAGLGRRAVLAVGLAIGLAGSLFLAACAGDVSEGGSTPDRTADAPPAAPAEIPAETPAETTVASPTTADPSAALARPESTPDVVTPTVVTPDVADAAPASHQRGMSRLDTGVDLTSLKPMPSSRFETGGSPPASTSVGASAIPGADTAVGPPVPPPSASIGHLSMVEDETGEVDFGKVKQGDKRTHVFRMVSDGEADLVISRFKSSCGCTVAKMLVQGEGGEMVDYLTGDPIARGKEFEVHVDLTTDGKPQGKMETNVSLYSNDVRGVTTVRLKAEVQTVLTVEPEATVQFGEITAADRVEGDVRITSDSLDPFLLTVDERFVSEPLGVELEPLEPDATGRSTTWNVHITLGPGIPEGLRNYPVLLVTDQEIPFPKQKPTDGGPAVYTARVYAQATVRGLVTASPGFLTFGMVAPGQVVERSVKIECFDDFELSADVPVRIEAMRPEMDFPYKDRFTWSLKATDNPKVMDLTLTLEGMPEETTGSFGGYVRVDVGHPMKESIPIRFSGVCRQGLPDRTNRGGGAAGTTGGKGQ